MSIYFGDTVDEELISELTERGYVVTHMSEESRYTFDEIEYAWNESGAGYENMGFTDFIAYLGVNRETKKEEVVELFPGTLKSLHDLGS